MRNWRTCTIFSPCTLRNGHRDRVRRWLSTESRKKPHQKWVIGSKTFKGWGFLNDPDPISAVGDSNGLASRVVFFLFPWDKDFSFSFPPASFDLQFLVVQSERLLSFSSRYCFSWPSRDEPGQGLFVFFFHSSSFFTSPALHYQEFHLRSPVLGVPCECW